MQSSEERKNTWANITATRTMLFEAYALFLEHLAPRWFLFENVPAIKSHAIFGQIIDRFNNLNSPTGRKLTYRLSASNYWASDFGVPQRRRRFLMVGYLEDAGIPGWTPPQRRPAVSVADALSDLPDIPSGHKGHRLDHPIPPRTEYQARMREPGADKQPVPLYNHITRRHNADDLALFGRMRPGAKFSDHDVQEAIRAINPDHKLLKYSVEKFQDKLHRLDPSRAAWTVTAHLQKDCYKFIHYSQPRTISVREAARLQSFPDSFVFPPTLGPSFRLIGNAVPPLLAQAFAESFRMSDPELSSGGRCAATMQHNLL